MGRDSKGAVDARSPKSRVKAVACDLHVSDEKSRLMKKEAQKRCEKIIDH